MHFCMRVCVFPSSHAFLFLSFFFFFFVSFAELRDSKVVRINTYIYIYIYIYRLCVLPLP